MVENLPDTNVGNIEYISKQDALDALGVTKNATKYGGDHSGYDTRMLYEIHDVLTGLPSADVVQVVRCRECKHYEEAHHWCDFNETDFDDDQFCSYGERREE